MARNKYPEETVQKILEISLGLFARKGYEKTSIQDIVNQLGMSKGAIYHHFKSKEEILERLCQKVYHTLDWFQEILQDSSLNGLEKLRKMFIYEIADDAKVSMDIVISPSVMDPHILAEHLKLSVNEVAPRLDIVLRQGQIDGSIHTEQTREAAEVIVLLINFWLNPMLFPAEKERFMAKVRFFGFLLEKIGVDLVDQAFLDAAAEYHDRMLCTGQA